MSEAKQQIETAPERQDKKELRERLGVLQKIANRALEIGIHDDLLAKIGNVNIETDPIETEKLVTQVEGRLGRLGLNTIKGLMEPMELSSIFRVLRQGGLHRKSLLYKTASYEGQEITVTPEIFNHLNLDFTIGTPPITKKHLATIYGAVLGTQDPNELKELCNVLPYKVRDDFLEMIYKMRRIVEGDNHYTADKELQEHLRCASNFVNLEGGRAFAKTVVSGGAKRAEELLRRYLFKEAGDKIKILEYSEPDKELAKTVKNKPDEIFIVKVHTMPPDVWSNNADWSECLGRIIFVDDSDNARKTNTCYVYSLFDEVIEALDDTHVKVSGKQSLPQMGLREILETFSADKLKEMKSAVEVYENSLVDRKKASTSEEENEAIIKDQFLTKQVKKFLELLNTISASSVGNTAMMSDDLRADVGSIWTKYFYRKLLESGYKFYVGNGGGREGLELAGRYRIQKLHSEAEEYLRRFRPKWEALYQEAKTRSSLTSSTEISAEREMQSKTKSRFERGFFSEAHLRITNLGTHLVDVATRKALGKLSAFIERGSKTAADILIQIDEAINRAVLRPDEDTDPRSPVGKILGEINDIGGVAKSHILRRLYEFAVLMSAKPDKPEYISDLLDKLLTTEKIDGRLVVEAIKWSYENVFSSDDFPPDLEIHIDLHEDGSPNLRKLREKLVRLKLILRDAPELFELVCKSITVVVNSPHNPTGRVYKEKDVLALLAVASEFGLTIIDDSSYHKVVRKDESGRRIRVPSVAEIYEYHKHLFSHPVTIITVATATKNQCGAGARLYNIITNDEQLIEFLEKERENTMPHAMSLHLTREKLKASAAIKEIYKILQGIERFSLLNPMARVNVNACIKEFAEKLSSEKLLELNVSYPVYKEVMDTYDLLCRLKNRGGDHHHVHEVIRRLMERLKYMRIEKGVAKDIDERFSAAEHAIENVSEELGRKIVYIKPEGAFYICVGLSDNSRPVLPFLEILNKHKGVGFSQMGDEYFVRLSLGAAAVGTKESYEWMQKRIETALKLLYKYWKEYETCDTADIFEAKLIALKLDTAGLLFEEKSELLNHYLVHRDPEVPFSIERQEDGTIFKIEESSKAVNIVLKGGACETPEDFIRSIPFRAIYTFLLRNFYGEIKGLAAMRQEEVLSKYPPELLLSAYRRDPKVSADEREILRQILLTLNRYWYGVRIRTHLLANKTEMYSDVYRRQQIMGASEIIGQHIATILTAFDHEWEGAQKGSKVPHGFARGYENLGEISITQDLPPYLKIIAHSTPFVGVTATTNPHPIYRTEMHKRISGREVLFVRRGESKEETAALIARLSDYSDKLVRSDEYLCKAVRVGPVRQLLIIHKALLHLLHDQCRLFPETEDVCDPEKLKNGEFDAVLFFGLPKKVMGEHQMTGYFVDQWNGKSLPVGWVARSNMTDYVGFVKKWLLTLHNEIILQKGAVPVHGALFTIHFSDGAKFTVVAAGDTATGKSELMAKFMEKVDKLGSNSEIKSIEFLAPDMMSLHTGEDGKIYALGTETGDFVRLDDLKGTEWEEKYAHLLYHATRTNPDKKNARATVPGLCDTKSVLTPQRVDGVFYFNNFDRPREHFTIMTVKQVFDAIKAGRRMSKGTSEDLPDFNACVEFSDRADLVKRFGMNFTRALRWDKREDGLYIAYSEDREVHYTVAIECVKIMFVGKEFEDPGTKERVSVKDISYSPIENHFTLKYENGREGLLTYKIFCGVYKPIIGTFYANPFGPTSNIDTMNKNVADLVEIAGKEKAGVIGGIVYTELANEERKQEGLDNAASDLIRFLNDPQFKTEVVAREAEILDLVRSKLGDMSANISEETRVNNIRLKRKHDAGTVALRSKVKTPYYQGGQTNKDEPFKVDIVPPSIHEAIENIILQDYGRTTNFAGLKVPEGVSGLVKSSVSKYTPIELIYLIMLKRGIIHFDTTAEEVRKNEIEVRKARYLANSLNNR